MTPYRITDPDDGGRVGRAIARSFDHLAANHYLVPDPGQREPVMGRYFGLLSEYAIAGAGEVYALGDLDAVAVWFDRTRDVEPPERYDTRLAELAGDHLDRFLELDEVFDQHHPADPHWHGAFFAVHPDHFGQGLGTALISEKLRDLDAEGVPSYLEGTNPANCRLYRALGWHDMTPFAITLSKFAAGPADAVDFYRMWRPPQHSS